MIKLEIEDYCSNCPSFEARISKYMTLGKTDTYIECEYKMQCAWACSHAIEIAASKDTDSCE